MSSRRAVASLLVIGVLAGAWYWRADGVHLAQSLGFADKTATAAKPRREKGGGDAVSVTVAEAKTVDLPIRLKSIGWVEPISTVAVKPRVQSQLLKQYFKEGEMVKQGALLFSLDDRELRATVEKDQATLQKDIALHTRSFNDLNRDKQLLSRNAGTQQAVDQATADEASASATILADRAAFDTDNLHLSFAKIYAPISGRIGVVNVTPGNLVNASDSGTGLVTITQMQPVRVGFALPERELQQLQSALANGAKPVVRMSPNGESGKEIQGVLTFIDSSVDLPTGTISAKATFANQDLSLWPGRYGAVDVQVGSHQNAVVAPSVAVQTGQNGNYVFLLNPDRSSVTQRPVKIGEVSSGMTEIRSGLSGGDKVVVEGQLRLSNGTKVRIGTVGAAAENDKETSSADKRG